MAKAFLYSIVTRDGRRARVEAESAEDALRATGIAAGECKPFYPFPVRTVLSQSEKIERAARMAALREAFADRRAKVRVIAKNKIEV